MKKAITDKNDNNNAGSSAMHIFKNHQNSIMYYTMSVDRLLKKLPVWKNAVPTY